MSEENNLGQQPAQEGDGDKGRAKGRWPRLNTPEWVTALATVAAAIAAIAAVAISYETYLVAKDTSDLKTAISTISTLATQTKRQADNSAAEVKALGSQFGEMQRQTTAFQTSASAAQGQLREMRDEQRPIVDVVTIESTAPLQTDPVIGIFVKFNLVNYGKSPAILAYPHAKLILGINIDVLKKQKEACSAPVKNSAGNTRTGFNIRAGVTMPASAGYVLTAEETKAWKAKPEARTLLVGCIDYMFDGRHHHTPFVDEVDRSDAASPQGWLPINPNTDKVDKGGLVFLMPPWYTAEPD